MAEIPAPFPVGHKEPVSRQRPRPSAAERSTREFERILAEKTSHRAEASREQFATVSPGDTLSEIVWRALKRRGIPFTTAELYRWVDRVAQANGLANPDLIYPGQRIDLSLLYGREMIAKTAPPVNEPTDPTFSMPVRGRISSGFGMRMHPLDRIPRFHHGIDIVATLGTKVMSVSAGEVAFAGPRGTYGNCVDIDHGNGWLTRYAHLDRITVRAGQEVERGSEIGTVGKSGRTTGPHLHFELHRQGKRTNPLDFIPVDTGPPASLVAHADREQEQGV